MSTSADIVEAALASGEWKRKLDDKSGRYYYVNKVLKKTTWNLKKELMNVPSATLSAPKNNQETSEHDQLLSRVKSRGEIEADLQQKIAVLVAQKQSLEVSVSDVYASVSVTRQLADEMSRKAASELYLVQNLRKDVAVACQEQDKEHQKLLEHVRTQRVNYETEKAATELRAAEYSRLLSEIDSMKRETHDRRHSLEELKQQIRDAEVALGAVHADLDRKRDDVAQHEQLLEERRRTLRDYEAQRTVLTAAISERRKEIEQAEAAARRSADMLSHEGGNASLRAEYEQKMTFWRMLEDPLRDVEGVELMSKENENVHRHLSRAKTDEANLRKVIDAMKLEVQISRQRVTGLHRDRARLESECRALMTTATRLEAEECT